MQISITSVPQTSIRSKQAGDWSFTDSGDLMILVLETLPEKSQIAVAIHEMIEALKCRERGTSDVAVSQFDDQFLVECNEGKHGPADEPGDDPRSPYREEHRDATRVEKAVCKAIGLSWTDHDNNIYPCEVK